MKTLKNKVFAILMLILGYMPVIIIDDCTALVIISLFAVPLFFARENWII